MWYRKRPEMTAQKCQSESDLTPMPVFRHLRLVIYTEDGRVRNTEMNDRIQPPEIIFF
jgi:hypothetical protein